MLAKLNRLTSWQAALIIVVTGVAVYFTGLTNPFQGDDFPQIVDNISVHSISNIGKFFQGGTFYGVGNPTSLSGNYFRPLMTTTFSLIYTLFGAHPLYFHLFQLALCISSAFILYLFFRYSFTPLLALVLSIIFLVHPVDSQVMLAIPSMQDALFFFFGILALWMLIRFNSARSLFAVVACLILSLLSKETGIVFVAMSLIYLFWWNRIRLFMFIKISILPFILYLALRTHAIGFGSSTHAAPINSLNLIERLMTMPSTLLFYIGKFLFPLQLSKEYYWTYRTFSVEHVLLPLLIDLTAIGLVVYISRLVRRHGSRAQYFTFLFFALWACLGLLTSLQIIPLDMTACEIWFYFPIAGLLGMIGVVLTVFKKWIHPNWFIVVSVLVIGILGFRTAVRGLDWRDPYTLALKNVAATSDDGLSYTSIAYGLIQQGKYGEAKTYALRSVEIYPSLAGYNNLGIALANLGDYEGATKAYSNALKYGDYYATYQNICVLHPLS